MEFLKNIILKQYRLPLVGWGRQMMAYLFFYLAPINFLLLALTSWHTTISPWSQVHAPWLNIWLFVSAIMVIVLVGTIIEYKLVLPSMTAFINTQQYMHSSPIAQDFIDVKNQLKKIECLLEKQNGTQEKTDN